MGSDDARSKEARTIQSNRAEQVMQRRREIAALVEVAPSRDLIVIVTLSCKFLQLSNSDLFKIEMLKYKALLCPESERFDDADGERCIRLWSSFGG